MAFDADSIFELDDSLPLGSDSKSFGDDNLREIKRVLKTSFPNSPLDDKYEGTLAQLTDLAAGQTLPRDTIIMWMGNQTTEPDGPVGWTICDGRARKEGGGFAPDLVRRFVVGAATEEDDSDPFAPKVGLEGGSNSTQIVDILSSQPVDFLTKGHALLTSELPSHNHRMFQNTTVTTTGQLGFNDRVAVSGVSQTDGKNYGMQPATQGNDNGITTSTGSGTAHTHVFNIIEDDTDNVITGSNVPSFHALLYLIKD